VVGGSFTFTARFSKYTPDADDTFDHFTAFAVADGPGGPATFQALLPKYQTGGNWAVELQAFLGAAVPMAICYQPATGAHPADELDDATLVVASMN